MEISFSVNNKNDISFVELHRYLSFIVFQKKYDVELDKETENYMKELENQFFNLKKFQKMSFNEINKVKDNISKEFKKQFEEKSTQFKNLKLIKEILEIDLGYYNKELENIKKILKNNNFKNSIQIINGKILSNIDLNDEELQKVTFYNKLINQKNYIEKIILSNIPITKGKKEIIKEEIFKNMKQIEKDTMIFMKEKNIETVMDLNEIVQSYHDIQLKEMINSIDKMIFDDKSEFLRYKIVENLKELTKKSYNDINIILKDNKYKQKLFGNLQISDIDNKMKILSEELKEYNKINNYLDDNNKYTYVCPLCNFSQDKFINVLLHMSLHNTTKYSEPLRTIFYKYDGKKYSSFSINEINSENDFLYNIKRNIYKDDDIVNDNIEPFVNKGSFQDKISVDNIIKKVSYKDTIMNIKENARINMKDYGKVFNIEQMINELIENEIKLENSNYSKSLRKINYKVFKNIMNKFFEEDDIINSYNTIINEYDDNLKSTDNMSFDLLFKNIIHYESKKPIYEIYNNTKLLLEIIKNIKNKSYSNIFHLKNIKTNKKPLKESTEYLNYNAIIMMIPILKNNLYSSSIIENIKLEENIEEQFKPQTWVNKKDYKKLINMISNILPKDFIVGKNNILIDDINEDFTRLNEVFKNLDMNILNKIEKMLDLFFRMYATMIKNNMFLHDIQKISSNKNIQQKYTEYLNSSFLLINMKLLKLIVQNNSDNKDNTKQIIESFYNTLSIYLNEESKYLKSNKNVVVRTKIIKEQRELDNKDELLNDFFESDDEEEQKYDNFNNVDETEIMEDLFGDDEF